MPAVSERDRRIRKLAGTVPGYFFLSAAYPIGLGLFFLLSSVLGGLPHEMAQQRYWGSIAFCAGIAGLVSRRWLRNPVVTFLAAVALIEMQEALLEALFAGTEGRGRDMSAYLWEAFVPSIKCGVAALIGWALTDRWLAWQDRRRQYWAGRR